MLDEYYQILKVPKNSTFSEIQFAFKKLSVNLNYEKQTVNEEDQLVLEADMRKITEAFNVLKNPITRSFYDKTAGLNFEKTKIANKGNLIREHTKSFDFKR